MESDALLLTVSHTQACFIGLDRMMASKGQVKRSSVFLQIFWITARSSVRSAEKRWVTPFFAQKRLAYATSSGSWLGPKIPGSRP